MHVDVDYAAHEAVYGLRLSVEKAVAFVQRTEGVDRKTAQAAVDKLLRSLQRV